MCQTRSRCLQDFFLSTEFHIKFDSHTLRKHLFYILRMVDVVTIIDWDWLVNDTRFSSRYSHGETDFSLNQFCIAVCTFRLKSTPVVASMEPPMVRSRTANRDTTRMALRRYIRVIMMRAILSKFSFEERNPSYLRIFPFREEQFVILQSDLSFRLIDRSIDWS